MAIVRVYCGIVGEVGDAVGVEVGRGPRRRSSVSSSESGGVRVPSIGWSTGVGSGEGGGAVEVEAGVVVVLWRVVRGRVMLKAVDVEGEWLGWRGRRVEV